MVYWPDDSLRILRRLKLADSSSIKGPPIAPLTSPNAMPAASEAQNPSKTPKANSANIQIGIKAATPTADALCGEVIFRRNTPTTSPTHAPKNG